MVGAYSPFVEETVTLNGKLNPANTNWMKIQVIKQNIIFNLPEVKFSQVGPFLPVYSTYAIN